MIKNAAVANGLGAASGFLRRLENQKHVVGEDFPPGQPPGQLQGDSHVAVVAAGVHFARMAGGEGQACGFGNRQGVHICPEGQAVVPAKVKKGAQGAFRRGEHLTGKGLQGRPQVVQGFRQIPVQLGNPVEGPAV